MAYALRYYKEIAQTDGGVVRLEIHKKDSTTSAVEIGAVVQGLSLEIQGQQDDIDTPIQKTSLHMTFVDASDIENGQKNGFWQEFYTPDALMWRVILKAKDAGETSFRTIWGGYVTPDSFSEDLVYRGSVSITARDNIGHMQDFPFDALGDADGLISLFNLVSMGWEKIQSPMDLSWNGLDWLSCNDVIAYHTLMNVSQFKDMNWYKAIETALASYGAVMRYAGENEVYVTTLRYMPSLGRNIDLMDRIEPTFIAGAQREFVPAVKRIEESVDYELESAPQPLVKASDFSGNTHVLDSTNELYGYSLTNTQEGEGWFNSKDYAAIYFSPSSYIIEDAENEDVESKMYVVAGVGYNNRAEYSRTIFAQDITINITFGTGLMRKRFTDASGRPSGGYYLVPRLGTIFGISYAVYVIQNGVKMYYHFASGEWRAQASYRTETNESGITEINIPVDLSEYSGSVILGFDFGGIDATIPYVNIASVTFSGASELREKNTINTIYNADNNVILSRDPELGPAFDKVALPAFIKNGIFYRSGDEILPARLWSWGGSEQQMAVWNHLQLLCYYAKPNNLISGTIVNADITRVAAIYEWNHAEHILVSGRYNFLNGHIEGAVLREFARYEDMWSEVAGAAMPETEQDSRSNVEGGASSSASPSTYTATQNVNIGTGGGGGASYLGDLQDVDIEGVVAQSVLYYNGTSWVDISFASLVNPLLNPYLKSVDAEATYATKNALSGVETAVSDNAGNIKKNFDAIEALTTRVKAEEDITATYKSWWDDLKSLIVKDGTNNIKINGNLIVAGDTSTGGTGSNPEVAGTLIGIKVNGTTYDEPVNGILTIPDYPTSLEWSAINGKPTKLTEFTNDAGFITSAALNGYATQSWVEGKNYLTSHQSIYGLTINNSAGASQVHFNPAQEAKTLTLTKAMVGLGNVDNTADADKSVKYATSAGSVPVTNTGNTLSFGSAIILGSVGGTNLTAALPTISSVQTSLGLGSLAYENSVVDALGYTPLSTAGGTITGKGYNILTINRTDNRPALAFAYNGTLMGYLGMTTAGAPIYVSSVGDASVLIHSGNIGSQNVASAQKLVTSEGVEFVNISSNELQVGAGTLSSTPAAIHGTEVRLYSGGKSFYPLILNPSGNVLIGTTEDYGYKLQVDGSSFSHTHRTEELRLGETLVGAASTQNKWYYASIGYEYEDSSPQTLKPAIVFKTMYNTYAEGTGVERMRITSIGNVGIGITPAYKLDVNGDIVTRTSLRVKSNDATVDIYPIQGLYELEAIAIQTTFDGENPQTSPYPSTYPKRAVLALQPRGGNVGIGTTTPEYKLDVSGDSRINGNLIVTGDTSTGSDIRFKDKLSDHRIALSDIANAPLFTFKWNDREDDLVHLGTSAQYWEKVTPWLVKGEDFKTLDYSTLGVAIGISLANKTLNHEERIKILEDKVKALEAENRRLRYGS